MSLWDLLAGLLGMGQAWPPGRVTVEDRYAMKRKVRELRERERQEQERKAEREKV